MGRKRQHGEATATALLDEAERIVEAEGLDALTVRRVAAGIDTTTRAVYTAFGSKDALLVALGARGSTSSAPESKTGPSRTTRPPTSPRMVLPSSAVS